MKSGSVFTKGTKHNVSLKNISATNPPAAKQDMNLNDDIHASGNPFTPANRKVLKREIACSEQGKAKNSDIRKPINSTTFTSGTKKEVERQIKSGEQKRISKKGAELYSDTTDLHDHSDVESNTKQNNF